MLYKEVTCPTCNGHGFISNFDSCSIWSKPCKTCNTNGILIIPITNGDLIRTCTNQQLKDVYNNLKTHAIYAEERLLDSSSEDFLIWLNKETDSIDLNTIFPFVNEDDYEHPYLKAIRGNNYD